MLNTGQEGNVWTGSGFVNYSTRLDHVNYFVNTLNR